MQRQWVSRKPLVVWGCAIAVMSVMIFPVAAEGSRRDRMDRRERRAAREGDKDRAPEPGKTAKDKAEPAAEASNAEAERAAAQKAFDELYTEDLKRVAGTTTSADDYELALRMVEDASRQGVNESMITLLCDEACDLAGARPTGYDLAMRAMETLARRVESRKVHAYERIVEVGRKQMLIAYGAKRWEAAVKLFGHYMQLANALEESGDLKGAQRTCGLAASIAGQAGPQTVKDLKIRQLALTAAIRVQAEKEQLLRRLEANPKDTRAVQDLVLLYVADLDEPGEAAAYLEQITDPALRQRVALANKSVKELSEEELMEAGNWYRGLAGHQQGNAATRLLIRARDYYQHYLSVHKEADAGRASVQMWLNKVEADLSKLRAQGFTAGEKIVGRALDLTELLFPMSRHDRRVISVDDGEMTIDNSAERHVPNPRFRVQLGAKFEIHARFSVKHPGDWRGFVFYVPVDKTQIHFAVPCGLDKMEKPRVDMTHGRPRLVRGFRAGPYMTHPDREYDMRFNVSQLGNEVELRVTLNGKELKAWKGTNDGLCPLDPNYLGRDLYLNMRWARNSHFVFHELTIQGDVEAINTDR